MAITREQLDELTILIQDLRMAMDIKEEIDNGVERGLVSFADGEKISVPIPQEQKDQLTAKITALEVLLKGKATKIVL